MASLEGRLFVVRSRREQSRQTQPSWFTARTSVFEARYASIGVDEHAYITCIEENRRRVLEGRRGLLGIGGGRESRLPQTPGGDDELQSPSATEKSTTTKSKSFQHLQGLNTYSLSPRKSLELFHRADSIVPTAHRCHRLISPVAYEITPP